MIPKDEQDEIIKTIASALKDHDLGIIVMRPKDSSLVIYINDPQSAIRDASKLNNKNLQGGN